MIDWRAVVAVAIGAAIGGVLRYVVGQAFLAALRTRLSLRHALYQREREASSSALSRSSRCTRALRHDAASCEFCSRPAYLGGYTTFSTFSLDAFTLLESGHFAGTCLYRCVSVVLGFTGARLPASSSHV